MASIIVAHCFPYSGLYQLLIVKKAFHAPHTGGEGLPQVRSTSWKSFNGSANQATDEGDSGGHFVWSPTACNQPVLQCTAAKVSMNSEGGVGNNRDERQDALLDVHSLVFKRDPDQSALFSRLLYTRRWDRRAEFCRSD